MKKIVLYLGLVLSFSCIEPQDDIVFYFDNASGVDVFIPANGRYYGDINIPDGSSFVKKGSATPGDIFNPFGYADNIEVIFGGNKIIFYDRDTNFDDPMNLLNMMNYQEVKAGKRLYNMYYTFTVEQYESAEPYEP